MGRIIIKIGFLFSSVFLFFSFSIFAQEIITIERDFFYTPDECFEFSGNMINKYINNHTSSNCGAIVSIPRRINEEDVLYIKHHAFFNKGLTKVVIPEGIQKIGWGAFANNNLKTIIIPDSVDEVGNFAFAMNELTGVQIGENLSLLGDGVFYKNNFQELIIPTTVHTIGDDAFVQNPGLSGGKVIGYRINGSNNITVSNGANIQIEILHRYTVIFETNGGTNIELLDEYGVPQPSYIVEQNTVLDESSIVSEKQGYVLIGWYTDASFLQPYDFDTPVNQNLTLYAKWGIDIDGDGIYDLVPPDECFELSGDIITDYHSENDSCGTDIVIPNAINGVVVKKIGDYAFYQNHLTSVEIPNGVEAIGTGAFVDNQLTSVEIPSGVTSIGNSAFYGNQLTSVIIPNSVTSIGGGSFKNNQLTSVEISDSVEQIGREAFMNNQLTDVNLPNSITRIGVGVFRDNELTTVNIPSSLTGIWHYVFRDNELTTVNIPNSIISIGEGAFSGNIGVDGGRVVGYRENGNEGIIISDTANIEIKVSGNTENGGNSGGGSSGGGSSGGGNSGGGNSGGGGNFVLRKDYCPNGDLSPSYYDRTCEAGGDGDEEDTITDSDITDIVDTTDNSTEKEKDSEKYKNNKGQFTKFEDLSYIDPKIFNTDFESNQCYKILDEKVLSPGINYSHNFSDGHQIFYSYGMTMRRATKSFYPQNILTRQEAAKILVNFAKNILCRKKKYIYTNQFTDLVSADSSLIPYIKESYEYGIFGANGHSMTFRWYDSITYDEVLVLMVKLITDSDIKNNSQALSVIKSYLTKKGNKSVREKNQRGNITELIYDFYKEYDYIWGDNGFVVSK